MTCFVSAVVMVVLLKVLHSFRFITWHPVAFLDGIEDVFFRYVLLGCIIYVCALLLFIVGMYVHYYAIASFFMSVIIVFIVECVLLERQASISNVTISFFVLTIVNCRFIMETAGFHHKQRAHQQ